MLSVALSQSSSSPSIEQVVYQPHHATSGSRSGFGSSWLSFPKVHSNDREGLQGVARPVRSQYEVKRRIRVGAVSWEALICASVV